MGLFNKKSPKEKFQEILDKPIELPRDPEALKPELRKEIGESSIKAAAKILLTAHYITGAIGVMKSEIVDNEGQKYLMTFQKVDKFKEDDITNLINTALS